MPEMLYLDATAGTLADPLAAAGLAEVVHRWLQAVSRDAAPIVIRDRGDYYEIALPAPLEEADVVAVQHPFDAGNAQSLMTARSIKKAGEAGHEIKGFDYVSERERQTAYFQQLSKLSPADRRKQRQYPDAPEFESIGQAPHPELSLYVSVNHFKATDNYNALIERWIGNEQASKQWADSDEGDDNATSERRSGNSLDAFHANLRLVLAAFGEHPNQLPADKSANVTLLQIVNPSSGKGGNSYKANGLGVGNLEGHWLLEYLKFIGYFTIATPLMIAKSKDRKTFVLRPRRVELLVLNKLMGSFRATMFTSTAVKVDILASLRFTLTYIDYARQALGGDPISASFGAPPRVTDISQGFDVAFYKDMGSAYATMNQSTINLPDWLKAIETPDDAEAALRSLDEHINVVRSIQSAKRDEGSEEIELLRDYRDFLSGHDVLRFIEFAAHFGDYSLGRRHRGQWMAQFTTHGMEQLMSQSSQAKKLAPVLASDGFRAIAQAIRSATVLAQYHAAREKGYPYDVRYGLGQDLLRNAAYSDEFIAALGAFLQSYNAENARVDERMQKGSLPPNTRRRMSIQTSHIDDIARLIDEHGSEVICKLLVAYGYARDPRVQEADVPAQAENEDHNQGNDGEE